MKDYPFIGSILGGLALAITALMRWFTVSPSMGFTALPIAPTSGATENATLKVATAIKPTATPGSVVQSLNEILDLNDPDVKFIVLAPNGALPRIVMLPISVSDATALSGESLIATVEPDEEEGESVPFTVTAESGYTETGGVLAEPFATAKPKKNIASALNAIMDQVAVAQADGEQASQNFAVSYDQSTDAFKVYVGATAGTLTGKLGDVQMLESESTGSSRSLRFGS